MLGLFKTYARIIRAACERIFIKSHVQDKKSLEKTQPIIEAKILTRDEIDQQLSALDAFNTLGDHVKTTIIALIEQTCDHENSITYVLKKLYEFAKKGSKELSFALSVINPERSFLSRDEECPSLSISHAFMNEMIAVRFEEELTKPYLNNNIGEVADKILSRSKLKPNVDHLVATIRAIITHEMLTHPDVDKKGPIRNLLRLFFQYLGNSTINRTTYDITSLLELLLSLVENLDAGCTEDWYIIRPIAEASTLYFESEYFDYQFFNDKMLPKLLPFVKVSHGSTQYINMLYLKSWLKSSKITAVLVPDQEGKDEVEIWISATEVLIGESIYQEKYIWFIEMLAKHIYPEEPRELFGNRHNRPDNQNIARKYNLDGFMQKWIQLSPTFKSLYSLSSKLSLLKDFPVKKLELPDEVIERCLSLELVKDNGKVGYEWTDVARLVRICNAQWANPKWVRLILMLLDGRPYRGQESEVHCYNQLLDIVLEVDPITLEDQVLKNPVCTPEMETRFVKSILWASENYDTVSDSSYRLTFNDRDRRWKNVPAYTNEAGQAVLDKFGKSDQIFNIIMSFVDESKELGRFSRSAILRSPELGKKCRLEWVLSRITKSDLPYACDLLLKHFAISSLTEEQLLKLAKDLKAINAQDYDNAHKARQSLVNKIEAYHPGFIQHDYARA